MRSLSFLRLITSAVVAVSVLGAVYAQESEPLWEAWETKEVSELSNDNSGATFDPSTEFLSPAGSPTLQITPSGTSDETKVAFPVSGTDLSEWNSYEGFRFDVYLPDTNTQNPNQFFLGMADVSNGWTWVDGLFGSAQGETGWIQVTYTPTAAMQNIDVDGSYMLYFSFFYEDASGKEPLTEPFYLGDIALITPIQESLPASEQTYQTEVDALLALDDEAFVDAVARETFDYFWVEANPENGLVKDRSTATSPASIAAVGFGLSALPIAVDRGWISHEQGYERALITLQTFANGGVAGEHGFFYHFVNMQTGERMWESELSSIDTALFIAGALSAGEYFSGTEVEQLAQGLYEGVDWQWMTNGRTFVSMGWKPDTGFLSASWDHFDESLIMYVLAFGSPTHPLPAEAWSRWRRPVNRQGQFIYLPGEPLFVYQYPQAWLGLQDLEDGYANYFNNTTLACERNRRYSEAHDEAFPTYQDGVWGISASDGPQGYRAYGAADGNHNGTVAPYASVACLPFTPEASLVSMRAMLAQHGSKVWREYGYVSAFNVDPNWFSTEHIGIDQGDSLLMIANYQDGFMWNLTAQNEHVQRGLAAMGFVESSGDHAVTPAYLTELAG